MAKKSSKNQPKQSNATNHGDTVTQSVPITSNIITNQPANAPQVDAQSQAITRLSFLNFITIATTEDIKKILTFAATTSEGKNLLHLWERAHKDGYERGRKSLLWNLESKMKEKFEEGVQKGTDLGREEGYLVAKEGFDRSVKASHRC
jgi:hypothetical protein